MTKLNVVLIVDRNDFKKASSKQFLTDDDVMLVFANTEYNFEDYILDKNKFYDTLRK